MANKKSNASLGALDALKARMDHTNHDRTEEENRAPETATEVIKQQSQQSKTESTNIPSASNKMEKKKASASKSSSDSPGPGRPKLANGRKRVQMTLTLSPETNNKLKKWAESMPKSAPKLISDYFDFYVDDFIKNYKK
ncbi:hypothetical protein ACTQZS_14155 [Bilifractor sp. LCP19S3_H10]|uniref:hypothetical protein n=1 Tax=Bilifractor sp. LCP19S3_H10 TaxID=3438736 RepID=UPI003F911435